MGSYRKAIMTTYICRLCSKYKSIVIHVYGSRARSLGLLEKISTIPIQIKKFDYLPKTICESCVEGVIRQYDLVQQIRKNLKIQMTHRDHHSNSRCPSSCPLHGLADPRRQDSGGTVVRRNENISEASTSRSSATCIEIRQQIRSILSDIENEELDHSDGETVETIEPV